MSFRILLADDYPDALRSIRQVLELAGHEVVVAEDGAAALRAALRSRPHVAIIDLDLPIVEGYALARCIRTSEELRGMVLICLSGSPLSDAEHMDGRSGFDYHLQKPVQPRRLLDLLDSLALRV